MKIFTLTVNLSVLTFLLFSFNQSIFAQSTKPPASLKLSILKKDKLVHDTILNIQDRQLFATESPQKKHKKKHIIHLKTLVAADGSEHLTVLKLENIDTANVPFFADFKIRIAPALTSTLSKERIGSLEMDSFNSKKGIFHYTHPLFKDSASPKTVDFEVYTKGADSATTLANFSMKIIQPGVVMVHGLNSSRKEFRALNFFLKRKKYKKFQLNSFNYTDSLGFARNRNVVPKAIDSLLGLMEKNMVLTSKVDLVGHSMGGIMSRLYVQGVGNERKDVNRLITCNTPHSGSPVANFVRDSNNRILIDKIRHFGSKKINLLSVIPDPNSQAVKDLQVGSLAIDSLLNGESATLNTVPCHSICSSSIPPKFVLRSSFAKSYYTIFKNENCEDDTHDGVVSMMSQKGGLMDASTSCIPKQWHGHSVANRHMKRKILELLQTNPLSNKFTTAGFKPVKLEYVKP